MLVIGPPRSGTSITARVLQRHLGRPYPFEVNRHDEPEALVKATNGLLERNGMTTEDRIYPEGAVVDSVFVKEVMDFLRPLEGGDRVVVKEPILTAFLKQTGMHRRYNYVTVDRPIEHRAESFKKRKKMSEQAALHASEFWKAAMLELFPEEALDVVFLFTKELFVEQIKPVVERMLGEHFKPHIVDELWGEE